MTGKIVTVDLRGADEIWPQPRHRITVDGLEFEILEATTFGIIACGPEGRADGGDCLLYKRLEEIHFV